MERATRHVGRAALVLAGLVSLNTAAEAQRLQGFADMHTHPMAHLAFGGRILYGTPDDVSPTLSAPRFDGRCVLDAAPGGPLSATLNNCNAVHGAPGADNPCGDLIRSAVVDKVEEVYVHESPNPGLAGQINDHPHAGHSAYAHWPHWSSVTHQQMRWEWIQRAHAAGLRVLVGLATHNALLAKAADAQERYRDDRASVELQLQEMTAFVGRHSELMQVALTPAELRDIVRGGRIAVVLGVETDDFGNLTWRQAFRGEAITAGTVETELRALHALGARYILPIHFSNTVLGGYAINKDLFALSSKEYTDAFPEAVPSCGEGIHFELKPVRFEGLQPDLLRTRDLGRIIDHQPVSYAAVGATCGHRNSRGLTDLGVAAVNRMMDLGMMIDVDHMSRSAADATLEIARTRDYPVNSGHNGPLPANCFGAGDHGALRHCNENARTAAQYQRIRELGGMIGLGHGGQATTFVGTYRGVLEATGNRPLAIGTDANGLEPLPRPDPLAPVAYNSTFPAFRFGDKTWVFNHPTIAGGGDGFAHYGMFPDYIRSWRVSLGPDLRMTDRSMDAFMSSAEGFARMWEKSVRRATRPQFADLAASTGWCTHAGATLLSGDFNGDGSDDLLCRDPGRLWIDYADVQGRIQGTHDWYLDTAFCTHAGASVSLADVDGDGRTDLVCRDPGRIWVDRADTAGRFGTLDWYRDTTWCTQAGARLSLGDFNGDGRADLFCRDAGRIAIDYADAAGAYTGTADWQLATAWCTHAGAALSLGDFNGDGRADLFCRDAGRIWIDYADRDGRFAREDWFLDTTWCSGTALNLGDFNGDGRTDLLCKGPGRVAIDFATSDGRFGSTDFNRDTTWCTATGDGLQLTDLNGDGRDDMLCRSGATLQVDYAEWSGGFSR